MLAYTLSRDHVEVWLCSVIKTKECTKRAKPSYKIYAATQ